mgnify:CR=1 FL=1
MSYQQDDWTTFLPLAEFAYNNTLHSSIGTSPFFANFGFQPRFSISLPFGSVNPSVEERARRLKEIHQDLTLELVNAQDQQKATTNHLRAPAPNFQVGDMVWLLRRNITTTRPCAKLDLHKIGPLLYQSRGLSTRPSTPLSHPWRFPCIPLGSLPSLCTSRVATCSTTAHRVGVWRWVRSSRNPQLPDSTLKTLLSCTLEGIPDIWSYLGTPFDACNRGSLCFPLKLAPLGSRC